jgi:hypothetical protein
MDKIEWCRRELRAGAVTATIGIVGIILALVGDVSSSPIVVATGTVALLGCLIFACAKFFAALIMLGGK